MHFTGFNGSTSVIANVPIGGVLIHTRTAHDEQKLVLQGINIYGKGRQDYHLSHVRGIDYSTMICMARIVSTNCLRPPLGPTAVTHAMIMIITKA